MVAEQGIPTEEGAAEGRGEDNPFEVPPTLDTAGAPVGTVLVVDPDATAVAVVADILAGDRHRVRGVDSLEAALPALQGRPAPDVVLVDPFAEGFGGLGSLDSLRQGGGAAGPEIIVTSAKDDADTAVAALHRGATDYVVKPVSSDRLRVAVVRALERRRLSEENTRLKRDLALFEAGRRLLETLDLEQLAERGIDVMTSFTGAAAALIHGQDGILAYRGMAPEEVAAIARQPHLEWATTFSPAEQDPALQRFDDGMLLDLGEGRKVLLLRIGNRFSPHAEEDGLFLARHLASAYKNVVRFTSAERRARRDPLTGLLNARSFEEAVHQSVVRSQVHGQPFSILFLDLDRFKQVNDTYGHLDGSRLLVELSHVIVRSLREGALVGRYGGDEFMVLLPGLDTYAGRRVGERLRQRIEEHRFLTREGLGVRLTACLGVANYPEHGTSAGALLDMADRAMYLGKAASRNAVHVADPGSSPAGGS